MMKMDRALKGSMVLLVVGCACCGCLRGAMPVEGVADGGVHASHTIPDRPRVTQDRYACPMRCEGDKTYPEPGTCPVCHMRLVRTVTTANTISRPKAGRAGAQKAGASSSLSSAGDGH